MEFARNATAVEIKEIMDFVLLLTLPRVVHLLEKNYISDGNAAGGIGVTEITHPYQSALARVRLLVLLFGHVSLWLLHTGCRCHCTKPLRNDTRVILSQAS